MSTLARSETRANIPAEEALVGAALISRRSYAYAVEGGITVGTFHHPSHCLIWAAVVDIEGAGVRGDVPTVTAHLRSAGLLDRVGGEQALLRLTIWGPSGIDRAAVAYPAQLVVAAAIQRRLVEAGTAIIAAGHEPPDCPTKALAHALGLVERASALVAAAAPPVTV